MIVILSRAAEKKRMIHMATVDIFILNHSLVAEFGAIAVSSLTFMDGHIMGFIMRRK